MKNFWRAAIVGIILMSGTTVIISGCSANDGIRKLWTMRSDESILRDIKHKFSKAGPEFLALDVIVRNQKVTLKGSLPNKEQKLQAEQAVWEVSGVDALVNAIEVK